jgi:hypothetical protein
MKKYVEFAFVGLISVLVTLSSLEVFRPKVIDGGGAFNNEYGCSTESIQDMYAGYIEEWKKEISTAFDNAEKKILGTKPTPDDEVVGPHPDADKCICGGSGWITHGDGHKTACPYHGSKKSRLKKLQEKENIYITPLLLEE